jgi:hypothetical protein
MNRANHEENFEEQPEELGLTPLQIAAILIAVGLLFWGTYHLFKSSTGTASIGQANAASRLSASELASLLNT